MNHFKKLTSTGLSVMLLVSIIYGSGAIARCTNPAPKAQPLVVPRGQSCPGWYGNYFDQCVPSDSHAGYAFVVPRGTSCPGNYSHEGDLCVATSDACYAYYSGGQCPPGFANQSGVCVSD